MTRTPKWPKPQTPLSKRLQGLLPFVGMRELGKSFFSGMSDNGVRSILAGNAEPSPSMIQSIAKSLGIDSSWLAWGDIKNPPADMAGGAGDTFTRQEELDSALRASAARLLSSLGAILGATGSSGKMELSTALQTILVQLRKETIFLEEQLESDAEPPALPESPDANRTASL